MGKEKDDPLYKGIEAMTTLKIKELSQLVEKRKTSKTHTAKKLYDKKIEKCRHKCRVYLLQLYQMNPEKIEELAAGAVLELDLENGVDAVEVK